MAPCRRTLALAAALLTSASLVAVASPASAATVNERLATLSGWTQAQLGSYNAWDSARRDQAPWSGYGFDWSTDYCSASPDQPIGFDFRLPCWRHDFGYRNYKAAQLFPANKGRLDEAFYADLKRKCLLYNQFVRPSCNGLAWTYYRAVSDFGSLQVGQADLDRAAALKAAGEAKAAGSLGGS